MVRNEFEKFFDSDDTTSSMQETHSYEGSLKPAVRAGGKHRIVSICADRGWYNDQLVKDCGVIPYLLHKNHNCDARMVGTKISQIYYNLQYVKGLQMEFLPDESLQTKWNYLAENAMQIDCLLLHGTYPNYFQLVDCYKKYNPNGRVCLVLDTSSPAADCIQWAEPDFCRFMNQCDVITASGHTVQRHLNEKWPWAVEFIPNGFYNFSTESWQVDFEKKENTILTVARLGILAKANHVLLEAFARIADQIPDWEVHLAGRIEEENFYVWLDDFWKRNPKLKKRIRFLGKIKDRETLYATYQKAKIFALTSISEGGTPNVIAEALFSGCAIATTKFEAYQDATNNGRCGFASEINDVDGFADVLLRLCQSERLGEMCRAAYGYAQEAYDMEKIVARLNKLIFGWEA